MTAFYAAGTNILLSTAGGNEQKYMGVMNTRQISTFASAESQTRFICRKHQVLVTIYDHAVHSFLMLMQSQIDVLKNRNITTLIQNVLLIWI